MTLLHREPGVHALCGKRVAAMSRNARLWPRTAGRCLGRPGCDNSATASRRLRNTISTSPRRVVRRFKFAFVANFRLTQ